MHCLISFYFFMPLSLLFLLLCFISYSSIPPSPLLLLFYHCLCFVLPLKFAPYSVIISCLSRGAMAPKSHFRCLCVCMCELGYVRQKKTAEYFYESATVPFCVCVCVFVWMQTYNCLQMCAVCGREGKWQWQSASVSVCVCLRGICQFPSDCEGNPQSRKQGKAPHPPLEK